MGELTWEEFDDRPDGSVVFLPAGSVEQHGPHLPLLTDVVIAEELAVRMAEAVDGLVAPPIQYGYRSQPQSGGGEAFPGTVGLRGDTVQRLVRDVLGGLVEDGADRVVVVPGHGENEFFVREGIDRCLETHDAGQFMIAAWWDLLPADLRDDVFDDVPGGFPGWPAEHAGVVETSFMLHFRPDLVRDDRINDDGADRAPPYVLKPAPDEFVPDSGTFYRATHATAEIGRRVADAVTEAAAAGVATEW